MADKNDNREERKPFVKPELKRQKDMPAITAGSVNLSDPPR